MSLTILFSPCAQADIRKVRCSKLESPAEGQQTLSFLQSDRRELQGTTGANVCTIRSGVTPGVPINVSNSPSVPCSTHAYCANFVAKGLRAPFQPCCIANDCMCGSTQMEFILGVTRCARFACTSDAQCGPGRCEHQQCSFANVEPECRTDAAWWQQYLFPWRVSYPCDPNTGFITLPALSGQNKNNANKGGTSTGGAGGGNKNTTPAVVGPRQTKRRQKRIRFKMCMYWEVPKFLDDGLRDFSKDYFKSTF